MQSYLGLGFFEGVIREGAEEGQCYAHTHTHI